MIETWISTTDALRLKAFLYPDEQSETAIVYCHGFSGSCSDIFHPMLCELLSSVATVVRFDFRGQGGSEGRFYDTRIGNEVEDVRKVLEFVEAEIQPRKVILVAHSFGAMVAILAAVDQMISGMVLLSGEGDLSKAVEIEFSEEQLQQLQKNGEVEMVNWSKGGEKEFLGKGFLDDLHAYSTVEGIQKLDMPILFIHGDADEVVPLSRTYEMVELAKGPKQVEILIGGKSYL